MWVAIGNPTATGAGAGRWLPFWRHCPADGRAFFLSYVWWNASRRVNTNNSLDVSAEDITTTNVPSRDGSGSFDLTETNHYIIAVHNDEIEFLITDVLVQKFKPYFRFSRSRFVAARVCRTHNSGAGAARVQRSSDSSMSRLAKSVLFRPWVAPDGWFWRRRVSNPAGERFGPNVTRGAVAIGLAGLPALRPALLVLGQLQGALQQPLSGSVG